MNIEEFTLARIQLARDRGHISAEEYRQECARVLMGDFTRYEKIDFGCMPRGILVSPKQLTAEALEWIRDEWYAAYVNRQQIIVDEGLEFIPLWVDSGDEPLMFEVTDE